MPSSNFDPRDPSVIEPTVNAQPAGRPRFWVILSRAAAYGLATGAACGAGVGTMALPVIGTVYGLVIGVAVGLGSGLILGLMLAVLSPWTATFGPSAMIIGASTGLLLGVGGVPALLPDLIGSGRGATALLFTLTGAYVGQRAYFGRHWNGLPIRPVDLESTFGATAGRGALFGIVLGSTTGGLIGWWFMGTAPADDQYAAEPVFLGLGYGFSAGLVCGLFAAAALSFVRPPLLRGHWGWSAVVAGLPAALLSGVALTVLGDIRDDRLWFVPIAAAALMAMCGPRVFYGKLGLARVRNQRRAGKGHR